jgi:uncharacterized MAPEG superfamily protein
MRTMLVPLLGTLTFFVLSTLLPSWVGFFESPQTLREYLRWDIGPRDEQLLDTPLKERAERAHANLKESLFVFLPLALLHLAWQVESQTALTGASIYLWARLFYTPAYLSGVPGLRSLCWGASWVGMITMLVELPLNF